VAAALDKPHQAEINESITCAVARHPDGPS
jgi:hypothetical protein